MPQHSSFYSTNKMLPHFSPACFIHFSDGREAESSQFPGFECGRGRGYGGTVDSPASEHRLPTWHHLFSLQIQED